MRVGLDVRLTYYTAGGIAKYIRRLAAALPLLAPEHEHIHFYRRNHAEIFSPHARRVECWTPAHHRLERLTLAAEVALQRLDLLHSPDFIPPLGGARRHVITVHDLTFLLFPNFLTPASRHYYNGHIHQAVKQAAAISADSQATKNDLVNLLAVPANKVTVIYLGIDPEFHVMEAEAITSRLKPLGLSPGYILYVGTFEPRKNIGGLLEAYARLPSDAPPLVLVGHRGWLCEPLTDRLRTLGLEQRVIILEELPAADLPMVYNGAAVLALPSHYEGFGFPVLEAMACGIPVVIADRASLPEIAGEAALKIDPLDPDALADALHRTLTDTQLRADLRCQGLERIRSFSWGNTARATLELYKSVL